MDPNADPYAAQPEGAEPPAKFGAEDIFDLESSSVTECLFLYRMW